MTPKQEKIWLLLKPGNWHSATDIGIAAGINTDVAYSHLRKMLKRGYIRVKADPGNSRHCLYQRMAIKPAVEKRADCRKSGDVWLDTWPHADPVVMAAMRAMIREGAQA